MWNASRASLSGHWYWAGGGLTLFAIISVVAARAHQRHKAPRFIGVAPGRRPRKEAKVPPLAAPVAATPLMVGREGELAQLREWFATVHRRERRVVFIAGETGIGKSTFVRAFLIRWRKTEQRGSRAASASSSTARASLICRCWRR